MEVTVEFNSSLMREKNWFIAPFDSENSTEIGEGWFALIRIDRDRVLGWLSLMEKAKELRKESPMFDHISASGAMTTVLSWNEINEDVMSAEAPDLFSWMKSEERNQSEPLPFIADEFKDRAVRWGASEHVPMVLNGMCVFARNDRGDETVAITETDLQKALFLCAETREERVDIFSKMTDEGRVSLLSMGARPHGSSDEWEGLDFWVKQEGFLSLLKSSKGNVRKQAVLLLGEAGGEKIRKREVR